MLCRTSERRDFRDTSAALTDDGRTRQWLVAAAPEDGSSHALSPSDILTFGVLLARDASRGRGTAAGEVEAALERAVANRALGPIGVHHAARLASEIASELQGTDALNPPSVASGCRPCAPRRAAAIEVAEDLGACGGERAAAGEILIERCAQSGQRQHVRRSVDAPARVFGARGTRISVFEVYVFDDPEGCGRSRRSGGCACLPRPASER